MTVATTNTRPTEAANSLRKQLAALFAAVNDWRQARRADRPRAFYHHHKERQLERARQDVNRLWLHSF